MVGGWNRRRHPGYTGVELLRLLARHPGVELTAIASRGEAGDGGSDMFPSLRRGGRSQVRHPAGRRPGEGDLVFFATPNGITMKQAAELVAAGVRVIDLASRLPHPRRRRVAEVVRHWSMRRGTRRRAVYGVWRSIARRSARVLANRVLPHRGPAGFLPLVEAGLIDTDHLIARCQSGVSGAGARQGAHPASGGRRLLPGLWRAGPSPSAGDPSGLIGRRASRSG